MTTRKKKNLTPPKLRYREAIQRGGGQQFGAVQLHIHPSPVESDSRGRDMPMHAIHQSRAAVRGDNVAQSMDFYVCRSCNWICLFWIVLFYCRVIQAIGRVMGLLTGRSCFGSCWGDSDDRCLDEKCHSLVWYLHFGFRIEMCTWCNIYVNKCPCDAHTLLEDLAERWFRICVEYCNVTIIIIH